VKEFTLNPLNIAVPGRFLPYHSPKCSIIFEVDIIFLFMVLHNPVKLENINQCQKWTENFLTACVTLYSIWNLVIIVSPAIQTPEDYHNNLLSDINCVNVPHSLLFKRLQISLLLTQTAIIRKLES